MHWLFWAIYQKIKKRPGTIFCCIFAAYFFHQNFPYLMLYRLSKFQYQTYFPSQDIKHIV